MLSGGKNNFVFKTHRLYIKKIVLLSITVGSILHKTDDILLIMLVFHKSPTLPEQSNTL